MFTVYLYYSKHKGKGYKNGIHLQFFISFIYLPESLIAAIQNDIKIAKEELEKPEHQIYSSHTFLTDKSMARKSEVILG